MIFKKQIESPKIKLLIAVLAIFFVAVVSTVAIKQASDLPGYPQFSQAPIASPKTSPKVEIRNNEKQLERIKAENTTGKFSFAVFGDSQELSNEVIKKILTDIDSKDFKFAIQDGDLVPEGVEENYQNFYDVIKTFKTPYLAIAGNHDISNCGEDNFKKFFGDLYYSFDFGNSLFILLNNSTGTISDTQMNWLENNLKKQYKHKFVFMHKPLFNPDPKINHMMEDTKKAGEIIKLLEKYKPDIVFSGHIHSYYDQIKNGVEYITSGGAGGSLASGNFHHYLKITVDSDKIEKEVVKW